MRPNPIPSPAAFIPPPITIVVQLGQEVHIIVADSTGAIPRARQERFLSGIASTTDSPLYSPKPSPDSPAYSPKPSPDKRTT